MAFINYIHYQSNFAQLPTRLIYNVRLITLKAKRTK